MNSVTSPQEHVQTYKIIILIIIVDGTLLSSLSFCFSITLEGLKGIPTYPVFVVEFCFLR